jgi:hypothetical protein
MLQIPWPSNVNANVENWWLDARTRSGGESLNGRELVTSSGLGRWRATLTIPLFERPRILAYRGWLAQMDGRSNFTNIGPCDCANGNRFSGMIGGIPHSDQTFHSDGAGYAQGGVGASIIDQVDSNTVDIYIGSTEEPLLYGSYVGFGGYFYVITGVTKLASAEYRLTVMPRIRANVTDGNPVLWCDARAPMRLLTDDTGQFDLTLSRNGTATLELVEVF